MARVTMLVSNSYSHDPRVQQEAQVLRRAGWEVTVLAWDRQGRDPEEETADGVYVRRCRIKSAYGLGARQMLYLPRFWWWLIREGRQTKPDVIHCHDLDTLPGGLLLGRWCGAHVLLDAHEHFPSSLRGRVPGWLWKGSQWFEQLLVRRVTAVITVGERLRSLFGSMGAREVIVVGNYKDRADFALTEADRAAIDQQLALPPGRTICYLGGLSPARAVLPLLEVAAETPGINVIVAGSGPLRARVEAICQNRPNLRYLDLIPSSDVARYTAYSDAVYYVLEPGYANNHFSTPNKLFEALAAGKPIICTEGIGEIADIVARSKCGIAVSAGDRAALRAALLSLAGEAHYESLAKAARMAYAQGYQWPLAEKELIRFYGLIQSRTA